VALLAAPPARALTWAYQGEIEDVATQINGTFSIGQTWSGTFSFDPSTPDTATTNSSLGVYDDAVSAHVFAVPGTWGGSGAGGDIVISASSSMTVATNQTNASFDAPMIDDTYTVTEVRLTFRPMPAGDALPTSVPSIDPATSSFSVQFKNLAGFGFTGLSGQLQSLEVAPAAPIPVPGMAFWSAALVTLALLGVGFRAAALAAR
jgi:hypothetical protein